MAPLVLGRRRYLSRIDEIEDVGEGIVLAAQIRAPQRDGDDFGAADASRASRMDLFGGELSGSEEQAGIEFAAGDDERLGCECHELYDCRCPVEFAGMQIEWAE